MGSLGSNGGSGVEPEVGIVVVVWLLYEGIGKVGDSRDPGIGVEVEDAMFFGRCGTRGLGLDVHRQQ